MGVAQHHHNVDHYRQIYNTAQLLFAKQHVYRCTHAMHGLPMKACAAERMAIEP